MRRIFIITGMIMAFGMPNLAYSFFPSIPVWESILGGGTSTSKKALTPPTSLPSSASEKEYQTIIELLTKQVEVQKKRISTDENIYHSLTGNRVINGLMSKDNMSYFFQNPELIYPVPQTIYSYKNNEVYKRLIRIFMSVLAKEKRREVLPSNQLREMVNARLKYSGIVAKAISLRAFQDAEKRFIQITNFLNDIGNTKNVLDVAELQIYIKLMLTMLHNESLKLQMIRNLSNNEEDLIDIQKRKIYGHIVNSKNKLMPRIRIKQNSL